MDKKELFNEFLQRVRPCASITDDMLNEILSLRQQLATEKTEFEQCSDMLTNAERHIETLEEQLGAAESKIYTLTKELEVQSYWGPRWEAEYAARMAALAACEVKQAALQEIIDLMSESYGLTGFHLNGDIAPWSELEEGGRFERLTSLNNAVTIQPDASALKAHDDALIERCAVVCEQYDEHIEAKRDAKYQAEYAGRQAGAMRCAAAIRELKGKL